MNLFQNSIKNSLKNGKIDIQIVYSKSNTNLIEFRIKDKGVGLEVEHLKYLRGYLHNLTMDSLNNSYESDE